MNNYFKEIFKGVWEKNPTFVLGIGMCATLAVSVSISNALWMGVATTFVLIGSNILVSAIRNITPSHIRIPIFIIIIAAFTTIVDLALKAYQPSVYKSLGIFIPLMLLTVLYWDEQKNLQQRIRYLIQFLMDWGWVWDLHLI